MHFQILKVVLWPRSGEEPRLLKFEPGMVNVITGASKTGKSAVIPIIDYCLASKSCSIPVGVIREKCAWFGIVVDTIEGQKLFARREPGVQQSTGDMFVLEATEVIVPNTITEKNTNDETVRALLDRLAGLTQLDFEVNPEYGFKLRPSFRDLAAFVFQPQNIVANPNVLFYKADTTEHREKLRTVLPYALNAVTPKVMALRHEADRLGRKLRKLQSELKERSQVSARRLSEARTWLIQARELGIASGEGVPDAWPEVLSELQAIASLDAAGTPASVATIDKTLEVLRDLRRREQKLVSEASTHRQRLMELKRLRESSDQYAGALRMQRERLALSTWVRDQIERREDAALIFPSQTAESLDTLCKALQEIEAKLQAHPLATTSLDAEFHRQRVQTESILADLQVLRQEIRAYEATSDLAQQEINRTASVERFLGGLQQILLQFQKSEDTDEITEEINTLEARLDEIQSEINESNLQKRLDSILNEIQQITGSIVPSLNVEWGDSPVRLNTRELTVQVSRNGRNDYLWEIGSGANWLAYHVAITIALQAFFLRHPPSPVPSFLVYDQPSQVYFPKLTLDQQKGEVDLRLTDQEDIQAVRRVFSAMGQQVVAAQGRLQVIVLDHADKEVWGNLQGVTLSEEWRGKKLVPLDW